MTREGKALFCLKGCGTELVKPDTEAIIASFLPRINAGDTTVPDDLNHAYSRAIAELNKEHLTTCTGPPPVLPRPSD